MTNSLLRSRPVELQPRDEHLLTWLARVRWASTEQIMRLPQWTSKDATRKRLSLLRAAGLLQRAEVHSLPFGVWSIARTVQAAGLVGPPHAPAATTVHHLLALTDLTHTYEARGLHVTTEWELRAAARAEDEARLLASKEKFGSWPDMNQYRKWYPIPAFPDMHVRPDGRCVVVIELELSVKSRDRLDAKLARYARTDWISWAVYLTHDPEVYRSVARSIERVGVAHRVAVQFWPELAPDAVPPLLA